MHEDWKDDVRKYLADGRQICDWPREQLEERYLWAMTRLLEGVEVVDGLLESMKWLGRTGVAMAVMLRSENAEWKETTSAAVKKIAEVSGITPSDMADFEAAARDTIPLEVSSGSSA